MTYEMMKIRNSGNMGNSKIVIPRHNFFIFNVYWGIFSIIMHKKIKIRCTDSHS